jgi:hypothetical protein
LLSWHLSKPGVAALRKLQQPLELLEHPLPLSESGGRLGPSFERSRQAPTLSRSGAEFPLPGFAGPELHHASLEETTTMTTRTAFAAVLVMGFAAFGCNGPTPTAPEAPEVLQQSLGSVSAVEATSAVASGESGNSGCYTVLGTMDQTMSPSGEFSGTISGDVEGTVVTATIAADSHGATVHQFVGQTWEVTGGIINPLIGQTVLLENNLIVILAKLPIIRLSHTARIVAGAQKGNLTYHGFTDVTSWPPQSHLEYRGVICP